MSEYSRIVLNQPAQNHLHRSCLAHEHVWIYGDNGTGDNSPPPGTPCQCGAVVWAENAERGGTVTSGVGYPRRERSVEEMIQAAAQMGYNCASCPHCLLYGPLAEPAPPGEGE